MKTNKDGLDLIKSFEGCRLTSYKDIVGILTIGYGATGQDVTEGLSWTQEQADNRLVTDLSRFEKGVSTYVKVPINDNEFSALVCFSYNVGLGSLQHSTLLSKLNSNDKAGAADQFLVWNKAGGKEVAGLTRRRAAERTLFLKSNDSDNESSLPDEPSEDDIVVKLKDVET